MYFHINYHILHSRDVTGYVACGGYDFSFGSKGSSSFGSKGQSSGNSFYGASQPSKRRQQSSGYGSMMQQGSNGGYGGSSQQMSGYGSTSQGA